MSSLFIISLVVAVITAITATCFQFRYFQDTAKYRKLFRHFFLKERDYAKYETIVDNDKYLQLVEVGPSGSDLNVLISQINHYIVKTKGTTDFAMIQNKVERMLSMRYDQASTHQVFPTYIGLMGTFAGVFIGICFFLAGFDGAGNISDDSIKNLLLGIIVSMLTSLVGLILTTINNHKAGEARKFIEEDKNEFYDFIQTELMPSVNVSLVSAISKLHDTVDRFEPAFNGVINRFQSTFDNCTKAFGDNFEKNVVAVAGAVDAMGKNMDKINENIHFQKELIQTMKSDAVAKGMDKYIEAAHQFVSITQSLDKFEEARRMMLAAAQESINLQNSYVDSLKIPREVAVRINQILDRIKTFEDSINQIGGKLTNREILGNDVVNEIRGILASIDKKNKIAVRFVEIADQKLEDLFDVQTKAINALSLKHKEAIEGQIDSFEQMIQQQTNELKKRHADFLRAMEENLSVEDIKAEFINLQKLKDIDKTVAELSKKVAEISSSTITSEDIKTAIAPSIMTLRQELTTIESELKKEHEEKNRGVFGGFFGSRN